MIISNGAAPAALALDELWSRNGKLATLSEETCLQLRQALPAHIDIANPLDLCDDASSEHYVKTLDILLASQILTRLWLSTSSQRCRAGYGKRPCPDRDD